MLKKTIFEIEVAVGLIAAIILLAATFGLISHFHKVAFPYAVVLQVPFTPQAPTNNWSRNEDCEESSLAMANAFLNGQTQDRMSAADALNAIGQLKSWEAVNIGYNANTGADATMQMAQGAFGILVKQIKDFTEIDLKTALAVKHVVLLPLNAKILNPRKYGDNGPLYHMIVVRGYHNGEYIVNDPGTDNGDGNEYTFETLHNAAADWDNAAQDIDATRKIILVLSK